MDDRQGIPARPESLAGLVAERAGRLADHIWVEDARSPAAVSFSALQRAVVWWRRRSADPQLRAPVGLLIGDPVTFATNFVALIAAGRTVVPLDPGAPTEELARLGRSAGVGVVCTDDAAPVGLPFPTIDGLTDPGTAASGGWTHAGTEQRPAAAGAAAGAVLLFSSGSTGARKRIRLDESRLRWTAGAVATHLRLGPGERGYNPLPLFHVNAEVVGLLSALVAGSTIVLERRFQRRGFWALMADRQITWINAVPAIVAILAHDSPPAKIPRGIRLIRSASAPLALPVLERFETTYGIPVIESYGMTEAASQITACPLDGPRRPGSVGRPVATELTVLRPDGAPCDTHEVGRIHIRGRGVIASYEEGVGSERFGPDAWLDTGDLGRVDGDGFVFLAGRSAEVINRGGEKVFPNEVEDVLQQEPRVRETIVVGRPDAVLGEVPVAYVTTYDGAAQDLLRRLATRCSRSLSRFKQPVELIWVGSLPKGPTGKVTRRLPPEEQAQLAAGALESLVVAGSGRRPPASGTAAPSDAATATPLDAGTATPLDAGTATPLDAATATPLDAGTATPLDAGAGLAS